MAVNWPSNLPTPIVEGYGVQRGDGREVTKMEQGASRVRLKYKNTPSIVNLAFRMTLTELEAFHDFWDVDLNGGEENINIEVVDKGRLQTKTVQVLALGQETPISSNIWSLSMQVETV
jgi:hypothetical protein